jgi:hypothetical protein
MGPTGTASLRSVPKGHGPAEHSGSSTALPPAPPKAGVAPGRTDELRRKIEGCYATTGGVGSFQITFRSGKAIVNGGIGDDETFECWLGGGKIILHEPGKDPNTDMPLDINDDGTLQTPFGEIKRKGN